MKTLEDSKSVLTEVVTSKKRSLKIEVGCSAHIKGPITKFGLLIG